MANEFDALVRLGNVYELDFNLDLGAIVAELKACPTPWQPYNPYRPELRCNGLPLEGGSWSALQPLLAHFAPDVVRAHFLSFQAGGHFPPQREGVGGTPPIALTLLIPISLVNNSSFVYIHDGERLHLEEGAVYFINTRLSHSAFSYVKDVTLLILHVAINPVSVVKFKSKLTER